MAKFRKKPVVVEAVQWMGGATGPNGFGVIQHFCPTAEQWACRRLLPNGVNLHDDIDGEPMLRIPTMEGAHWALTNDWIVKGVEGEFYPVKPEIFAKTYEPVKCLCGSEEGRKSGEAYARFDIFCPACDS